MDTTEAPAKTIEEFDAELAALSIEGYWKTIGVMPSEPKPRGDGFLWRWAQVHPKLLEASRLVDLEEGAERRSLRLCTPGMTWKSTTDTIHASIQMVLPGEIARAHRHSAAAFRFVIQGNGGYTVVNGERYMMEPADLILTPQTCWHDHGNLSAEPMIWLDVLDFPFIRMLNALFYEAYNDSRQEIVRPEGYVRRTAGAVRAPGLAAPRTGFPYHYKGAETIATLRDMPKGEADSFDGVTLDYVNPVDGGPTMPTNQCRLHLLSAGGQTRRHRHTWNSIYHVVEGEGETAVGDKTLRWGPHDTFSVPAWQWHAHRAARPNDAIVFSVSDDPIYRAFALDRVEVSPG